MKHQWVYKSEGEGHQGYERMAWECSACGAIHTTGFPFLGPHAAKDFWVPGVGRTDRSCEEILAMKVHNA